MQAITSLKKELLKLQGILRTSPSVEKTKALHCSSGELTNGVRVKKIETLKRIHANISNKRLQVRTTNASWCACLLASAASVLVANEELRANPSYGVRTDLNGPHGYTVADDSGEYPVSVRQDVSILPDNGVNYFEGHLFASADLGLLNASSFIQENYTPPGLGSFVHGASSQGRFTYGDIIITGPEAVAPASLNLSFSGGPSVSGIQEGGQFLGDYSATAVIRVVGNFAGHPFSGEVRASGSAEGGAFFIVPALSSSGIFGSGDPLLTTDSFMVPTNTPLSLDVQLFAEVGTSANVGGTGPQRPSITFEVNADAAHSMSLPASGPVFNLLNGYTVSSDQAQIVDNRFVGAVPESSSFSLVLLGALTVFAHAGCRRWRSFGHRVARTAA